MKKIHRKKNQNSNKKRNASLCKHTSYRDDPTMKAGKMRMRMREAGSEWVKKNRHHSIASERECRMKEKLMKCLQFGSCVYVIWILPMRINFDFFLFRSFFTLIFAQWSLLVGTTCVSCASPLIIMIAVGGGGGGVFVVDFLPFYLQRFDLVL